MTDNKQLTKRPGPPKWNPDLKLIHDLSEIQCNYAQIAAHCGVSIATIKREVARNQDFKDAIDLGRASGAVELRRAQWAAAMDGSIPMQIWLGKQFLGQSQNAGDPVASPEMDLKNRFLPRAETIKDLPKH
jgi:hypothetical protein